MNYALVSVNTKADSKFGLIPQIAQSGVLLALEIEHAGASICCRKAG